jgi:hypothetical protein
MLSQAVAVNDDPEALNELGELLEQMGEQGSAMKVYKEGLKAAAGVTTTQGGPRVSPDSGTLIAVDNEAEPVNPNLMPVVSDPKTA